MVVRISDTVDNAIDVSVLRKSYYDDSRIGYDIFAFAILQVAIHETTARGYIQALFWHKEYLYPMARPTWHNHYNSSYEFYVYVSFGIYY